MRDLLLMPRESLVALGKRSRAFVERWHDPLNIARDIKEDYEKTQDLHVEVAK